MLGASGVVESLVVVAVMSDAMLYELSLGEAS